MRVIGDSSVLPPDQPPLKLRRSAEALAKAEGGSHELRTGVIRRAFRMAVTPGHEPEYARRHQPIWPDLEAALLACGVRTYSIFLDAATSSLFAYVEFDSVERWEAVAQTDVCRRWWAHMRELMPSNPDNSPITTPLEEVFHIER
jgi:L-rhamnose mutarotase